jgi:hypothetical protein
MLIARGRKFDAIAGFYNPQEGPSSVVSVGSVGTKHRKLTFDGFIILLEQVSAICAELLPYSTGESRSEICMRTFMANRSIEDETCLRTAPDTTELPDIDALIAHSKQLAMGAAAPPTNTGPLYWGLKLAELDSSLASVSKSFWLCLTVYWDSLDKVVFWTRRGYLGVASSGMKEGDEIWLLDGASVPFLTRKSKESGVFPCRELVSEAYIHGMMNGEGLQLKDVDTSFIILK